MTARCGGLDFTSPSVPEGLFAKLKSCSLTRSLKSKDNSVHIHVRATATTQNPTSLKRKSGTSLLRSAERRELASMSTHEPPRNTRYFESPPFSHAEPSVGAPL